MDACLAVRGRPDHSSKAKTTGCEGGGIKMLGEGKIIMVLESGWGFLIFFFFGGGGTQAPWAFGGDPPPLDDLY